MVGFYPFERVCVDVVLVCGYQMPVDYFALFRAAFQFSHRFFVARADGRTVHKFAKPVYVGVFYEFFRVGRVNRCAVVFKRRRGHATRQHKSYVHRDGFRLFYHIFDARYPRNVGDFVRVDYARRYAVRHHRFCKVCGR